MTAPVVTVPCNATVKQAIRLLYEHDITAAPVVDVPGHMVGIVSEMDLLRGQFEADPRAFLGPASIPGEPPPRRVSEVMTPRVITVTETADAAEVAGLMMTTGIKSVPVLRGEGIVGVVSRRDLMGVLARTDERIRADVLDLLEEHGGDGPAWDVTVRDGAVRLRGRGDERAERLADTLARTVPGVTRVDLVHAATA